MIIEISEKSFELLKKINDNGHAEFRDSEFESLEEFSGSLNGGGTPEEIEQFERRNFCDLKDLSELIDNDLIDINDMSWHLTYKITEKGQKMLKANKPKSDNIKVIIYIPVDKKTDFWYQNLNGMVYNVREGTSYDDFMDTSGLHNKEPKDCYIVTDGEFEKNIILKEDCKLV